MTKAATMGKRVSCSAFHLQGMNEDPNSSRRPQKSDSETEIRKKEWTQLQNEIAATRNRVREVWQDMKKNSCVGVQDETLYELSPDTVPLGPRLGHGVPILRAQSECFSFDHDLEDNRLYPSFCGKRTNEVKEFARRLDTHAPFLASFMTRERDPSMGGLVLAGGCVIGLLASDLMRLWSDYDFFFVKSDQSPDLGTAIWELGDHLAHRDDVKDLQVCRSAYCVTFCFTFSPADSSEKSSEVPPNSFPRPNQRITVQCILREYHTQAEVIHGFDLNCCAALYNGKQVLLTRGGVLALQHGALLVYFPLAGSNYEARLMKYWSRGFDWVLPDLSMEAMLRDQCINSQVFLGHQQKLLIKNLQLSPCACHAKAQVRLASIYSPSSESQGDDSYDGGASQNVYHLSDRQIREHNTLQILSMNLRTPQEREGFLKSRLISRVSWPRGGVGTLKNWKELSARLSEPPVFHQLSEWADLLITHIWDEKKQLLRVGRMMRLMTSQFCSEFAFYWMRHLGEKNDKKATTIKPPGEMTTCREILCRALRPLHHTLYNVETLSLKLDSSLHPEQKTLPLDPLHLTPRRGDTIESFYGPYRGWTCSGA